MDNIAMDLHKKNNNKMKHQLQQHLYKNSNKKYNRPKNTLPKFNLYLKKTKIS